MVKQGDRVRLDGREAKVETQWGSGKHTTSRLSDGREVLDLHVLVANGTAEILQARPEPAPELTRRQRRELEREETPMFGEDHED